MHTQHSCEMGSCVLRRVPYGPGLLKRVSKEEYTPVVVVSLSELEPRAITTMTTNTAALRPLAKTYASYTNLIK